MMLIDVELWLQYYLALRQCHSYIICITAQLGISNLYPGFFKNTLCCELVEVWGREYNTACLVSEGGGGGLYLTSLCSTSPPQGGSSGCLSSIVPTATVSLAIGLYGMHGPKQKTVRQKCRYLAATIDYRIHYNLC